MSAFEMDIQRIGDYKNLIPGELYAGVETGQFMCVGGAYLDEPAGALVYEELSAGGVLIRSIFVENDYRRLGIGSEMMEEILDKKILFTYEATGDRASLEPFFDSLDIDTIRLDCPICYLPLKTIEDRMKEFGTFNVVDKGSTFADLSTDDRKVAMKWMVEACNERGEAYEWIHPDSAFLIEDGRVRACVLVSDMETGLLSVDLVYSDHNDARMLMGLLSRILINVGLDYEKTTDVKMIMTAEDGRKFFEKIFGKAEYTVPVIAAA